MRLSANIRAGSTGLEGREDDGEIRAIYLDTLPEPVFASIHLPRQFRAGAPGVLLCPPFGWDELCTHRVRRAWAIALADAGYPAMRLDLPGTGDSGGTSRMPGWVPASVGAVSAAASWLRNQGGCDRVVALGIGFGGMLAWMAAAEGAAIDDFILWGAPLRGRRLVQEARVGAAFSIDANVEADISARAHEPEDMAFLDEAGQVVSIETVAALQRVDLRQLPLPAADHRRALVFQRREVKADTELTDLLHAAGARVVMQDGDGYGDLMRYVQDVAIPQATIDASLEWLADAPEGLLSAYPDVAPVLEATEVELLHDGVAIREAAVTIDLPSGSIRGIVTQPLDAPTQDTSVLFFSGGSDRRIGPNRLWVEISRRWAAHGVTAVRVDPRGVGDSDGDQHAWDRVKAQYHPRHVHNTIELLDELGRSGLPNRFILVGFCSGANRSFRTALTDSRVAAVVAIALPFLRWRAWTVHIRDSWLPAWKPEPGDSPLKIKLVAVLKRCLKVAHAVQPRVVYLGQFFHTSADRAVEQLADQGTQMVFILRRVSYMHEQLTQPARTERVLATGLVELGHLPGDDQRFRPLASQQYVTEAMDRALERVLAGAAGEPATGHLVVAPFSEVLGSRLRATASEAGATR